MRTTVALILILTTQTCCSAVARAQSETLVGRWQVNITFTDTSRHTLRLEVQDPEKASFLLLDTRSSLLEPAKPSDARWAQPGTNAVELSGPVEFPIGNVGRDAGQLILKGTFETPDLVSGEVAFFRNTQDAKDTAPVPSKTGTFRAIRVATDARPRVQLLSQNSGGKLRRGKEVKIDWQAESAIPIDAQQVFLSPDNGETYVPISDVLGAEIRELTWTPAESMPKVKKALLMVIVVNTFGDRGQDITKEPFKIK